MNTLAAASRGPSAQRAAGTDRVRDDAALITGFIVLWYATVLAIRPFGEFPLNDDWSFTIAVKRFVEQGTFHPTGWTGMTLLSHTLWGSLFVLPEGFSFSALRLSSHVMAMVAIAGLYVLLRSLGSSRFVALAGTATLAFNPVYYAIVNTFMTDGLFIAATVWASYFFVRHLRLQRDADLAAAVAVALVGVLCRQVGLFMPLAFGVALVLQRGLKPGVLLRAGLPMLLCAVAVFGLQHWLKEHDRLPMWYAEKTSMLLANLSDPKELAKLLARSGFTALVYIGLYLAPVALLAWGHAVATSRPGELVARRMPLLAVGAVMAVLGGVMAFKGMTIPIEHNMLIRSGLGPLTLHDTDRLGLRHWAELPPAFWLVVSAFSLFGTAVLLVRAAGVLPPMLRQLWPGRLQAEHAVSLYLLLATLILMTLHVIAEIYDRYYLVVTPLLTAFLLRGVGSVVVRPAKAAAAGAVLLVAGFAWFAVAGTHDFIESNRLRWQATDWLAAEKGAKPTDIDGGFEYNGWHLYSDDYQVVEGKSYWWVQDDRWMLAFGPVPGYAPIKAYPFERWLIPGRTEQVLVLERRK